MLINKNDLLSNSFFSSLSLDTNNLNSGKDQVIPLAYTTPFNTKIVDTNDLLENNNFNDTNKLDYFLNNIDSRHFNQKLHLLLTYYNVNLTYGFIPQLEPLTTLPSYYSAWQHLVNNLSSLIQTNQLRSLIQDLPLLDVKYMTTIQEFKMAFVCLSFLTHAYVFGNINSKDNKVLDKLPMQLAIPFCKVSKKLGLNPVVCTSAVCLWNWTLKDKNKILELDNLKCINTFTQTKDEEWFYLITTAIELLGGKCLKIILQSLYLIHNTDNTIKNIVYNLDELNEIIIHINSLLNRMYESCRPSTFYNQIRPFLSGWLNMEDKGLPNGIKYEGADFMFEDNNPWRKYAGGSAGQSSLIQLLDIFLGVEHYPTLKQWKSEYLYKQNLTKNKHLVYLVEMRNYMPKSHRQFLFDISEVKHTLRKYVERELSSINELMEDNNRNINTNIKLETLQQLKTSYNKCVDGMRKFRDIHLRIVSKYIVTESKKANLKNDLQMLSLNNKNNNYNMNINDQKNINGTGGTDLVPFLKQCRDETNIKIIKSNNDNDNI